MKGELPELGHAFSTDGKGTLAAFKTFFARKQVALAAFKTFFARKQVALAAF